MRKITIKELTEATGLSRATIDRALNGRGSVHPRTRKVIDAALEELRSGAAAPVGEDRPLDVLLRVGRGMMAQVAGTLAMLDRPSARLHDMHGESDAGMLARARELCADPSRPLILTAKSAEPLRAELAEARARGKRIVTFISDLPHDARDAFVSIDNRMAGECAAFVLGGLFREREARFGVIFGDYAFSCHEEREMGFRAHLRAHFPRAQIVHEGGGEDEFENTRRAVAEMLAAHPDLDAVYNVAGGNAGLAEALRAAGRVGRPIVLTHETNHITAPLLREGVIDYALAQDTSSMVRRALRLATLPSLAGEEPVHHVDFGIYTRFNLPAFVMPRG
ncbi:LacI family DNA-binding transcriptional regulator [Amaricoccus solimangrovi]|uniref:Substrate-binding domain-containing protein n=1 Tax=Amaricoccus solimangrovi TaxID=2589815 RepID=A0A501WMN6_9RHOB|nr:LacI family DNA-binding transcriptional regulator [Amaricoccus solimangrovi]TPE49595.1 substrate-binding domain-containing protein [Amaricoccus solimangrovi]